MSRSRRRGFIGLVGGAAGTALFSRKAAEAGGFLHEPAQSPNHLSNIPVLAKTDVLVVGGGPAGLAAAIASAREGAATMLVERYGFFGGMITQAIMGSTAWYLRHDSAYAGGLHREFQLRAKEMGGTIDPYAFVRSTPEWPQYKENLEKKGILRNGEPAGEYLDPEMFKYVADVMILEAGVKPLLHSYAMNAVMDGNTITGVVIACKSGPQQVLAKRVVDATGDADIAFMTGAPFYKGPKNELMELTPNYSMHGIDVAKYNAAPRGADRESSVMNRAFEEAQASGDLPPEVDTGEYHATFLPGENPPDVIISAWSGGPSPEGVIRSTNTVFLFKVDPTDVFDLTRAEIQGRKYAMIAINALRKHAPGFANAKLQHMGTSIGIRESRKIVGLRTITADDIRNQARFDDSVGICPEFMDGYGVIFLPTAGRYFQVPYGSLVPREVDNLVVAGRCVSGDRLSLATLRNQICCALTGQAAGVAAAASIKQGRTIRQVDVADVQARLKRQRLRIE